MTTAKNGNSIEVLVISAKNASELKTAYSQFNKSGRAQLESGCKLGLMLVDAKKKFVTAYSNYSEQYASTKFGQFIESEIGISKSHRNLLMQIVSFDGLLHAISEKQVNSISEARDFMAPKKAESNTDASGEGSEGEEGEGEAVVSASKDVDKVLSILKQLDKLGINNSKIEKAILDNASKVLGCTVKRESAKVSA